MPKVSPHLSRRWRSRPWLEWLEDRLALSVDSAVELPFLHTAAATQAELIALNTPVSDLQLNQQAEAFFALGLTQPGNLTVRLDEGHAALSLSLYDAQGRPIVRSDGERGGGPTIRHALPGGPDGDGTRYFLKVANLGAATTVTLTALFTPSVSTLQGVALGGPVVALARGDFNGDDLPDIATAAQNSGAVTVLLASGRDGTFQSALAFDAGIPVEALTLGDFTGDDTLDLVVANAGGNGVALLVGNGDGTFASPAGPFDVQGGEALAVGDFNGDDNLDLVFTNRGAFPDPGSVTVLLGNGDGTFQDAVSVAQPGAPIALAVGDFDEDGRLDVVTADEQADRLTVLLGQGDGTFAAGVFFAAGSRPNAVVVGDVNGDDRLDLAATNARSDDVTILLGDGRGRFMSAGVSPEVSRPTTLITGDFDGDNRLDLAVASFLANAVTVLLGQGDGTFRADSAIATEIGPVALVAGDVNGDGRDDLAVGNRTSQSLTVLLGSGAGTFPRIETPNATGPFPDAVAAGDFNGDGQSDLAVANAGSGSVTVLLGQGDGSFGDGGSAAVGTAPVALAAGDFNVDGRLDLAVANAGSDDLTILLGDGTGSFQPGDTLPLSGSPSALVAADVNGDATLDLAVAIRVKPGPQLSNDVVVLLGQGDGSFRDGGTSRGGPEPLALVAGDFSGDGHLDLAVASGREGAVAVLLGDGAGNFRLDGSFDLVPDERNAPFGTPRPLALVAGDFNGDGLLDFAAVGQSYYYHDAEVFLNQGDGAFAVGEPLPLSTAVSALSAGDFDGDGRLDLATVGANQAYTFEPATRVIVLLGNGDGTLQAPLTFPVGADPNAVAVGEFNGDGRPDLVVVNGGAASVTTLLGAGTGAFVAPGLAPDPVRSTPRIGNVTGGGTDALVLTQTGTILLRRGLVDQPGAFGPAVVLNPDPTLAARDLALVRAGGQTLVAALPADGFRVSLYQAQSNGTFAVLPGPELPTGVLSANLIAADLTGSGLDALVMTATVSDQVFVSLQTAPGVFTPVTGYAVGVSPSAVEAVDVNGDRRLDLVVVAHFSGQLSVLLNRGDGTFFPEERYRAGTGLYGLTAVNDTSVVQSLEATVAVAAGDFDDRPGIDLIALNEAANSLSLLSGTPTGGFLNPTPGQTVFAGASPQAVVAGNFSAADANLDLAVLSGERALLSIYRGDGGGGFRLVFATDAGNRPTGLSVADVSRPGGGGADGLDDLLIGNAFGDLLILTGNGDGTFSPYRRADENVFLAAASSPATGRSTLFLSAAGADRLAFQSADAGAVATVFQDRASGIQAPGPQVVVTVQDTQYLVVANTGGNNVLVYTLDADGRPDPLSRQSYFAGTSPRDVKIAGAANDLNGDAIPDVVVANEGSNDVSVFLGRLTDGAWTLASRPRQNSGGLGPTSTAIADVTDANGSGVPDGLPDVLVSNGQSNAVSVLAARGNGFFVNATLPTAADLFTGINPRELLVGNFDGVAGLDLVTLNTGSNDVTLIANFLAAPVTTFAPSGGTSPLSAVAVALDGGASALLVANAGDGILAVLFGGPNGFDTRALIQTEAGRLADLALVAVGDDLNVYATETGRETALLLGTFGSFVATPNILPPAPGFPGGLEIANQTTSGVTPSPAPFLVGEGVRARDAEPPRLVIAVLALELDVNDLLAQADEAKPAAILVELTGAEEPDEPDKEPRQPQPERKGAEILLLNLVEPEEFNEKPNTPEEPEGAAPDAFWEALGTALPRQEACIPTRTAPGTEPEQAAFARPGVGAKAELEVGSADRGWLGFVAAFAASHHVLERPWGRLRAFLRKGRLWSCTSRRTAAKTV